MMAIVDTTDHSVTSLITVDDRQHVVCLQMDHIEQNILDVMERYNPKVPRHRYSINFVPVIDKTSSDIKEALLYDPRFMRLHVENCS